MNKIKKAAYFIAAQVVKLNPNLAMRFTLKTNPYAEFFMLSHKKEMAVLQQQEDIQWVNDRIWSQKTRIACLSNSDQKWWKLFADSVQNKEEFTAAFWENQNEVLRQRILDSKSYTLSMQDIVNVCCVCHDFIPQLLDRQRESFTPELVKKFDDAATEALLKELINRSDYQLMAKIDAQILALSKDTKVSSAFTCLHHLLTQTKANYCPSFAAEELVKLNDYQTWLEKTSPVIVAPKMFKYWQAQKDYKALFNLFERLLKMNGQRGLAIEVFDRIPQMSHYFDNALAMLIEAGTARPKEFYKLFQKGDKELILQNLELCIKQKICYQITVSPLSKEFPPEGQEMFLVALASENALSPDLYEAAPEDIKPKLFDILEDNAQLNWFRKVCYAANNENIECLRNIKHLYGKIQDESLNYATWAEIFAKNNLYDEEHLRKLFASANIKAMETYVKENEHKLPDDLFAVLLSVKPEIAIRFEKYRE